MNEQAPELEERIVRTLNQLDQDLPTIPVVLSQVMSLTASDTSSVQDLTKILNQDQALTARILRVANSAYYGLRNKVTTIERAVVTLGFDMVRNLAASASFIHYFSSQNQHKDFPLNQFWVHATAVGVYSSTLARERGGVDHGDAFTAGILHDIGKLVMLVNLAKEFGQVLERVARDEMDFHEAEMAELGVGHDFVGGLILRRWNIPETLASAVEKHHKPLEAEDNFELAAILHITDFAARRFELGASGSPYIRPLSRKLINRLGMTPQDLKALLGRLAREKDNVFALISALD